MNANDFLLSLLAAGADDESIIRGMSAAVFGLTGEVGSAGFGATTLEGYLVLFTHPEFFQVAGLPPDLQAVEATSKQAAEYAKAVSLRGFVLNPGTHQRFIEMEAIGRLHAPLLPPAPQKSPVLIQWADPSKELSDAVRAAAESSSVGKVWLAQGPTVATEPHPDPAFEAGLLARDIRMPSYAAQPAWKPIFEREAAETARIRMRALPHPLDSGLTDDLAAHARRHRLSELWAFQAAVGDDEPTLALAYAPHPHDAFAADFNTLHMRHGLGEATVPLLSASDLGEALEKIGTKLA